MFTSKRATILTYHTGELPYTVSYGKLGSHYAKLAFDASVVSSVGLSNAGKRVGQDWPIICAAKDKTAITICVVVAVQNVIPYRAAADNVRRKM